MPVTKSVVSLLLGTALDKGFLQSIDQPVLDFFPDYTIKRGEKAIQQVTIRHLLIMTAPYKYRSESWTRVCSSEDWTVAALEVPGGRAGLTGQFQYSTLGSHILTGTIAKTSELLTVEFANQFLFLLLGIAPRTNYLAMTASEHKEFSMFQKPMATSGLSIHKASARQGTVFVCLRRKWRKSVKCVLTVERMVANAIKSIKNQVMPIDPFTNHYAAANSINWAGK